MKKWDKEILEANDYKDFTTWHLKELVRLRFLPEDFPVEFLKSIINLSGRDLLEKNKNSYNLDKELKENSFTRSDFESWNGFDMIFDFYRLKNAGELAVPEIGTKRLKQYELICKEFKKSDNPQLVLWSEIFYKTMNGEPSNHFKIDLKSNRIDNLSVK